MEQAPTYLELMTARWNQLAPDQQALWKDLTRSVESGNTKRVELTLNKITTSDWFADSGEKKLTLCVGQMLFLTLKEAYGSPKSEQFEVFTSVLPVFTEFLTRHAKIPELKDHPKFLLTLGEQFAVSFFDSNQGAMVNFDNFYEFHLQNIRDFLASPGFKAWKNIEGTEEFLKVCISRWLVHLGNFARNRREKPFLNLLDLSLLLLRTVPEFLPAFQGILLVLPTAKKSFHYMYSGGEDGVLKILAKAKLAANPDLKPVINEWSQIYNIGALPDVPRAPEYEESPELTIPFVYRTLIEEVLGDGNISPDEEAIVKSVRDFLEIPNEKYNMIFEQVQEARKLQKIKMLDRDFSPRAFLLKILQKTIEDGVITDEEKSIIGKVAHALLLNQETIAEVFKEAKASFAQSEKPPVSVSRELGRLHELVRYTAMEERIRPILVSDRGMKLYIKAGKVLASLRKRAEEKAGPKAADLLGEWPVATFYFEPQTSLLPVIVLFVDSPNVHPARLEFKGGRIDVEFLEEVKAKKGEDTSIEDRPLLRMYNSAMELEIPIKAVLVGDSLQVFLHGLEETKGKYSIMMMHHAKMSPILAVQKTGYVDASGNFSQAWRLMNAGRIQEAMTLLSMINQGFPTMQDVWYSLGVAQERLAEKNANLADLRQKAQEFYKREIDLNPASEKAMRALGRLLSQEQKFDDALFWLQKAHEAAPASIQTLAWVTETSWRRDCQKGNRPAGIPEYVSRYLGDAFQIFPRHPRVVALTEMLSKELGVDLPAHFRSLPVSTLFQ